MQLLHVFKKIIIPGIISILVLSSCKKDKQDDTVFSIDGIATKSDVVDGSAMYIKLVYNGNSYDSPALYSASAVFNAGEATYSISHVEKHEYMIYAFIDMNGNAVGTDDSSPDSGDYATEISISVDHDVVVNLPDEYWLVY